MKAPFILVMTALVVGQAFAQDQAFSLSHAIDLASPPPAKRAGSISRIPEEVISQYYEAVIADLDFQAAAENIAMDFSVYTQRMREAEGGTVEAEIAAKAAEVKYRSSLERRSIAAKQQRLAREKLKNLANLKTPPANLDALSTLAAAIVQDVAPLEDLVARMFKHNSQLRQAENSKMDPKALQQLKTMLHIQLLENRLEFDRIVKGSIPRVTAEVDHADLALEKARDDLAAGRKSDIGYAMARTSDAKVKQGRVQAELALTIWRLENLVGAPLKP
jgi:hypothetical protein